MSKKRNKSVQGFHLRLRFTHTLRREDAHKAFFSGRTTKKRGGGVKIPEPPERRQNSRKKYEV